ncbi:MAG: PIG-L family deacetylase [Oscillospiraceae bacterium]|nr:PIG-L family deacetylase [Oscillospiraceae bacterium]
MFRKTSGWRRLLSVLLALGLLPLCACAADREALAPVPVESVAASLPAAAAPEPSSAPEPVLTPEPALTPESSSAAEPLPSAEPEARRLEIRLSAGEATAQLLDGNPETCCRFAEGAELLVTADEDIGALYLLWYDRPQLWTLELSAESLSCGAQGFLHEFVPLPRGERELTIRFPQTESIRLSEIRAYSPGRMPDDVQIWQSPCEQADILLFPAHADDEFIFFGGIIPLYAAERGLDVQLVYMISHYGSLRIRCHELLDALWFAGIRHYPVVNDAPDREIYSLGDAEYIYGKTSFLDFQVEQIRRFRPLVIVTHAENGEYKQGCHILSALSMERAVVLAADESYQSESAARWGVWDTPKTYLHLYGNEKERTVLDFETPLDAFGGKTAFTVAEEAFALHASQAELSFRVYESGHAYDCHSFGLYRSLVGPDRERRDLMENLDPAEWRN